MDDAEVVTMLREVFSNLKGKGDRIWDVYVGEFSDEQKLFLGLVSTCNRKRIVEAYDDMIEITDYFSRIPGLNPDDHWCLKPTIDELAMYFTYVWCENKETLDKERPEEIFLRLLNEVGWGMRTVVFVLGTFRRGEIGYMDTPGGGIGNMDLAYGKAYPTSDPNSDQTD
jgi:hypothetical protein